MRRFFWSGQTTQRRLATAGEAAVDVEQSSEDEVVERCDGEAKCAVAFSGDVHVQG
jgi:hypothetical protein